MTKNKETNLKFNNFKGVNEMKKDLIDQIFESESPVPVAALVVATVVMTWAGVWFISIII
jgi:hypothetical protein